MEEALRDECSQWDILTIFLHLFLGILRALESEVLEPCQHPSPGINSTDQLIGGAKGYSKGQVLGVVPCPDSGHNSRGTLKPSNYLQTAVGRELGV